jgi:hypothetical protein
MYQGLYDTRKGLSDADARIIGAMTARLILSWERWIHRRVERITFCDADALRRDVSVDFTLPNWFHDRREAGRRVGVARTFAQLRARSKASVVRRQLVPIGFLRKGVLVNFSLRDESDVSLPLLNAPQNTQVSEAVLVSIASRALEGPVPSAIRCDIRDLVRADHDLTRRPSLAQNAYKKLFETRDAALAERERLEQHQAFSSTASTFLGHFLALAIVELHRYQRRILHFSYEESLHEDVGTGARRLFPFVERLARGEPRVMAVSAPAAAQAQSYHLEVEAPEGHMISKRESFWFHVGNRVPVPTRNTGTFRRAHFHLSHLAAGSKAAALVHLLPRPYTIVRGAAGTSTLALVSIASIAIRYPSLDEANAEVATSVLLAFVGLMSLFMIRSGEQDISTTLLFPLRSLVTAPIALSFASALVVLSDLGTCAGTLVLAVFALLAAGATSTLYWNWWSVSHAMRSHEHTS